MIIDYFLRLNLEQHRENERDKKTKYEEVFNEEAQERLRREH